jgi:hypothetical protein
MNAGRLNTGWPAISLQICKPLSKILPLPAPNTLASRAWRLSAWLDRLLPFLLTGLLVSLYGQGLASVPFHPDESTYLYMSADFEKMIANPASLAWDPVRSGDYRQQYRLLDAPLARLALGFARSTAGLGPLPADWDWSLTWEENARIGALPSQQLLLAGRLALAAFFPLSLACLYLASRSLSGRTAGLLAITFFGTHALVLLHTRRAMAEAGLLWGVTAFLACLPSGNRRPWLVGLALALAFNAKHSSLALLPAGLLAAAWLPAEEPGKAKRALVNTGQLLGTFGLLSLVLNPVFWGNPVGAGRAALAARQELIARQLADIRRLAPAQALESPGERSVALLAHLYLAPPMFAETGNYRDGTAAAEDLYLASPLNTLWRSTSGAAFLLGATLLGLAGFALLAWRETARRRLILLFLLAAGSQAAGLLFTVPLPWQRYSLPLVPFACLLAANGIVWVASWFRGKTDRYLLRKPTLAHPRSAKTIALPQSGREQPPPTTPGSAAPAP